MILVFERDDIIGVSVATGVPTRIFGLRYHVISTFGRDLATPLFKSLVGYVSPRSK